MQPFLSLMRHPAAAATATAVTEFRVYSSLTPVTFLAGWTACGLLLIALVLIRAAMRRKHRTGIVRKPTANLWGVLTMAFWPRQRVTRQSRPLAHFPLD